MAALLQIGLINAFVAALLACVVALVARKIRRPALTHALWIVVLAKLITPPVVSVPIEVPFELPAFLAASTASSQSNTPPAASADLPRRGSQPEQFTPSRESSVPEPGSTAHPAAALLLPGRVSRALAAAGDWISANVVGVIVSVWLLGTAAWFLLQGFTAYKFSQRLALATPAPAGIQREADELAAAMGLAHRPPVMLVRDVISPMLWGVGRNTRLLFPVNLVTRLDAGARATLIAHELAHFRRGDHWVRAFELVVSGLFWWNPVVWWARRQIEIAEEQCCDAWVIEQFPETPRWYAEALLETIDFLSEAALVLPPAAAGAGHIPFLRERLTAIMRGVSPQRMTLPAWLAVACVACASLPWHPGLITARDQAIASAFDAVDLSGQTDSQIETVAGILKMDEMAFISRMEELQKRADADLTRNVRAAPTAMIQPDVPWATAKSPNGRYSITRRGSDGVYLYDAITNQKIDLSEFQILTVAFSSDGERFATGGADRLVRLWSSSAGVQIKTFRAHYAPVHSVAFVAQDLELLSASSDGQLWRWDLERDSEQSPGSCPHTPANCLAASADGRWLAIGTGSWMKNEGGRIVLWDLATMDKLAELRCDVPVGVLTFKPDGKTLAAGDFTGRVTFWDVLAKSRLGSTLPRFKDAIAAARFSLDTQALSSVDTDDIFQEPEYETPSFVPFLFDRSANLPHRGDPVARATVGQPAIGQMQHDSLSDDPFNEIRRGIIALERDLAPPEPERDSREFTAPLTN